MDLNQMWIWFVVTSLVTSLALVSVFCIAFKRYSDADLRISLYVCVHKKTIPWTFCIPNPNNSRVICPWSL